MPDFPTDPRPNYPIEETAEAPEVLISVHRDGSEQRRYKGAGKRRIFKLSFGGSCPVTSDQRSAILDHYTAQRGQTDACNWTHPERGETCLVRYSEAPAFNLVGFNCYEGTVVLQEVLA
jgi:phage-related protein